MTQYRLKGITEMAEDRTKQTLQVFDGATKVAEGAKGAKTVAITGLAAGTKVEAGKYKVAWADGSNLSAKVDVPAFTVTPATKPVTGVTVAPKTANVKVGAKTTIVGTVAPADATDKAVTYSSSDTSIATVNATSGEVTGVKVGTATITATTHDGAKKDTAEITVEAA